MTIQLWYTLDQNKNPVPCDRAEGSALLESEDDRTVARATIGNYFISTVFLAIDHNYRGTGPPILFETMLFLRDPRGDLSTSLTEERYATWDEAVAGHVRIVARVRDAVATGQPFVGAVR